MDNKTSLILREVCNLIIPAVMLYALYVQFHGDYGPGGGFQAGVIFRIRSYSLCTNIW